MADIIRSSDFRVHFCDLCGEECDQATSILNALDCSFPKCTSALYHQECLEKYLRSIKCEKNRKTGFKCPRGCGKGTKHDTPCNGKITKSHPIQMQGEVAKKRKQNKQPDTPAFAPMKAKMADKAVPSSTKMVSQPRILVKAKTPAPKPTSPPAASPAKRKEVVRKTPPTVTQPLQGAWAHKAAAAVVQPPPRKEQQPIKPDTNAAAAPAAVAARPPPPPPKVVAASPKKAVAMSSAPGKAPPRLPPQPTKPVAPVKAAPVPAAPSPLQAVCAGRTDSADAPLGSSPKPPPPPPRTAVTMPAAPVAAPTSPTAARKLVDSWDVWPPSALAPPTNTMAASKPVERLPQSSLSASLYSDAAPAAPDCEAVQAALQAIALRKTLHIASRLRQVGFPEWACMAAVARHGTNLEASLEFLMSLGTNEEQCTPESLAAEVATKPLIVDTGEERTQLYRLADRCSTAPAAVARAVVDCGGDLDTVASLLLNGQQHQNTHAAHQQPPHATPWSHGALDGATSPPLLTSGPSSFAFSSLQEGTLSPASGLYSPTAAHPHSPGAMQPPSPGTPHSPTACMHRALFAPPSPPAQASPWTSDDPWNAGGATMHHSSVHNTSLWGGGGSQLGLWGPPVGGRDIPPPPPRAVEHDGAPKAALMAAAQVGLEAFEDADLHTMMAALMCG